MESIRVHIPARDSSYNERERVGRYSLMYFMNAIRECLGLEPITEGGCRPSRKVTNNERD